MVDAARSRVGATFGDAMAAQKGVGAGFDYLRILLAVAIFYGHSKWAAGQAESTMAALKAAAAGQVWSEHAEHFRIIRPIQLAMVPMFFALSGYLVMGSAMRLRSTTTFLAHRALRIFPALAVEVMLSALLLGPAFTALPLHDYFGSPTFWAYLGNAVGSVSFVLPGVFLANPVSNVVNVNLWTLPSELHCYIITAACMALGVLYDRRVFTVLIAAVFAALAVGHALTGMSTPDVPFPGHVIVLYFLCGLLFQHWQRHIRMSWAIFVPCLAISYACLASYATIYLAVLPLVYVTVFIGALPLPRLKIMSSGDYSYGIYLYGFPITQALVALLPGTFVGHLPILLLAALPCTALFAVASWHGIEKHALAQKRRLPASWFPAPRAERAFASVAASQAGRAGT